MTTLKYTLDQVRDRELGYVGTLGIPNAWWPITDPDSADCLAFQLFCMGIRTRGDLSTPHISIGGFLATTTWEKVSAQDIRPGDLALQNWDGGTTPKHAGLLYSRVGSERTTIEGNTSPAPGIDYTQKNRGVAKKTRPAGPWLILGVRPPYANTAATVTPARRTQVRLIAAYLNHDLAGPDTDAANDGIPGPLYWTLVQIWGRAHGLYGDQYVIDGVVGPRTRIVEAKVYALAKKK